MATAYSSEMSVGTYNRLRLKVDYSGTSATCTIQFRRTSAYSTTWSDSGAKLTFNGTTKNASYSYSGNVGTSWINLVTVSGYSVSTSGSSYSFSFTKQYGVLECSGSIWVPGQNVAPNTPTISAVLNADDSVSVTWGTTSLGTPTGTVKLYGDTNADPSTELASKSTTGNTTFTHTGLNPGTTYYYKAYASNSVGNKTSSIVSVTTPEHAKLYGSVNGQTKRVKKLYGPIGVVNITNWSLGSQTIVPGFDPTTMTALDDMAGELTADIVSIAVTYTASGHKLKADVNLSNGKVIHYITDGPVELVTVVRLARLGCDASIVAGWRANDSYPSTNLSDTVTITSTYTSESKKIKKLYGSVNGQTKLIYQG